MPRKAGAVWRTHLDDGPLLHTSCGADSDAFLSTEFARHDAAARDATSGAAGPCHGRPTGGRCRARSWCSPRLRNISASRTRSSSCGGRSARCVVQLKGRWAPFWVVTPNWASGLACEFLTLRMLLRTISVPGKVSRSRSTCSSSGTRPFQRGRRPGGGTMSV